MGSDPAPHQYRRDEEHVSSKQGDAPISRLRAQSAHLLGEAVIVMIQPETVAYLGEVGTLMSGDTTETAVKAAGGKPLTLPPNFAGEPAPGWTAQLNPVNNELVIRFPGGLPLYDGTMPTVERWRKDVADAGSVVVITGPMASPADMEPVLVQGRAHWTRIAITIGADTTSSAELRVVADIPVEETTVEEAAVDPEAVTAAAVDRGQAFVKEMRKRYPGVLGQMTHFADQKGAPGAEDWPDWCWVPMAGAYAVVCPTGVMLPGDPRVDDMARVAALSTWWLTKGVYWIDDEAGAKHVGQAWSSPGVPVEKPLRPDRILNGLPQQCVYIALPPHPPVEVGELPHVLGAFVHLEYDYRGGRPELRLLLDRDGTWDGLTAVPVLLDRPTLLASARELAKPEAFGGVQDEDQREILAQLVRLAPFLVWPAVEALLDHDLVISGWDLPGEQPQPAEPRTTGVPRWKGAAKPARWRVGITAPKAGLRTI
jgi:hypothetical protein